MPADFTARYIVTLDRYGERTVTRVERVVGNWYDENWHEICRQSVAKGIDEVIASDFAEQVVERERDRE